MSFCQETLLPVLSWKYINQLRLWARVLAECRDQDVRDLVYPFMEACLLSLPR